MAMGKLFKMKFNECAQDPEVTGKLVSNMTRRPKQRDSEHSFRTRAFRLRLHRPRAPVFAADAPGSCTGSVRILYHAPQDKVAAPRLAAQTFRVFFRFLLRIPCAVRCATEALFPDMRKKRGRCCGYWCARGCRPRRHRGTPALLEALSRRKQMIQCSLVSPPYD